MVFGIKKLTSYGEQRTGYKKYSDHGKTVTEFDTNCCCHCGCSWPVLPKGSKVTRGFCFKCKRLFCGPGCVDCIPMEKRIDYEMRGKDVETSVMIRGGWAAPSGSNILLPVKD